MLEINNDLNIETFNEMIMPQSDIADFIPDDTDLIINTADEPYIGHISIKIGRYAWDMGMLFYVGGGFDAHIEDNKENIILGGAGSLAACSLFSASFVVMRIVYHLLGIESKELDKRWRIPH